MTHTSDLDAQCRARLAADMADLDRQERALRCDDLSPAALKLELAALEEQRGELRRVAGALGL
jgi:hypothetical protein